MIVVSGGDIATHVSLKPSSTEDLPSLNKMVKWLNDKELMKYSEQRHQQHTVESQKEYIRSFNYPSEFYELHDDIGLIGTITAHVDSHNSVADVGILIGEHRHSGLGQRAWRNFCVYLFGSGIRKVEAGCMAKNIAMSLICTNTGMSLEGRKRRHFQIDGEYSDLLQYGRFTPDV